MIKQADYSSGINLFCMSNTSQKLKKKLFLLICHRSCVLIAQWQCLATNICIQEHSYSNNFLLSENKSKKF